MTEQTQTRLSNAILAIIDALYERYAEITGKQQKIAAVTAIAEQLKPLVLQEYKDKVLNWIRWSEKEGKAYFWITDYELDKDEKIHELLEFLGMRIKINVTSPPAKLDPNELLAQMGFEKSEDTETIYYTKTIKVGDVDIKVIFEQAKPDP
jgi:hypothetical protein